MSTTPDSKLDTKIISKLAEILDKNNLTHIEYEDEGCRINLGRDFSGVAPMPASYAPAPIQAQVSAPAAPAKIEQEAPKLAAGNDFAKHPGAVKSPMVGVVYLSPEPAAPAYVKAGDSVKAGDTLCLIEAMKTYNPVKADKAGKVSHVLVESGAPVEYGEILVVIE